MNDFANNFRMAYPTGRSGSNPLGEQVSPGFQLRPNVPHGKMPENYGEQQNAIGLTAISLLLSTLGFGAPAIMAAIDANSALRKPNNKTSSTKEDIEIIDTVGGPSPEAFLKELKPMSLNGSYEDNIKILNENNRILENMKARRNRNGM